MSKTLTYPDKKRTTIYISPEVLEFLAIRRVQGEGSVSQQLETLARAQMPRRYTAKDIAELEAKDIQGYQKQPIEAGEFDPWLDEQVWDEE